MNYRVNGYVTVAVSMLVEDVESASEALDEAEQRWPGLTGYAGNGSPGGRLIGPYVDDTDATIEANDAQPTWSDAVEE